MQIEVRHTKQKMGQKGAWPRSRDLLSNIGTPIISCHAEDRNVKFCTQIEGKGY